ncbi:MAG: DUF4012 domain-containing protein [Actinomycetota bacterium]
MTDRWWHRDDHVGRVTIPSTVAAVAAVLAIVLADSSPTGWSPADALWRAGGATALTLLSGRAAPWAWIVLGAGSTLLADGPWVAVGAVALALAIAGAFADLPVDLMGAAVGAVAALALFHADVPGPLGTETIAAVLLALPVAASGSTRIRSRTRSLIASAVAVVGVAMLSSSIAAGVLAVDARDDLERSVELVEEALDRARDGEELLAADRLAEARELWQGLDEDLSAPWLVPARATPVVGHHLAAVLELGSGGSDVAGASADLLSALDEIDLAVSGGGVDLDAISGLQAPADDAVARLDQLVTTLDDVDSPWLVAPAADRLDEARDELTSGLDTIRDAQSFLTLAPELLGRDGAQRYLVLFGTTAETRGGGGFVGNYAVVTADGGRLSVAEIGRGEQLNEGLPAGGAQLAPELIELYRPFGPQLFIQNIALSPDYPVTASAALDFYEQATGETVDGVLLLDPTAMQALIELTGPVTVDGRELRGRAVAEFVLIDNYIQYDDDEDARLAALDELVLGVAARLTTLDVPSPWVLADIFGPVVERGGLRFWSPDPAVLDTVTRVGFAGEFPTPDGGDLLAVVTRNMGGNKIDAFLERRIDYVVDVDPSSGALSATLTIELENTAPATGLPDAIIGNNDRGFPLGTNVSELTVYTPSVLGRATVDGRDVAMSTAEELGWLRHRYEVQIPAESTITVVLELEGIVDVGTAYRLDLVPATVPRDDEIAVTVGPSERWERDSGDGDTPERGPTISSRERLELRFERADS